MPEIEVNFSDYLPSLYDMIRTLELVGVSVKLHFDKSNTRIISCEKVVKPNEL